jgi:hypothetical protein
MLRVFSLVGVAFLAAVVLAVSHPTSIRTPRQERQPDTDPSDDPRGMCAALPCSTRPLYLARFSLN